MNVLVYVSVVGMLSESPLDKLSSDKMDDDNHHDCSHDLIRRLLVMDPTILMESSRLVVLAPMESW